LYVLDNPRSLLVSHFQTCKNTFFSIVNILDKAPTGGIHFSDCLIYCNRYDIQVALKKKYNDTFKSSKQLLGGNEWYCHQAFRALNQAAGKTWFWFIYHILTKADFFSTFLAMLVTFYILQGGVYDIDLIMEQSSYWVIMLNYQLFQFFSTFYPVSVFFRFRI